MIGGDSSVAAGGASARVVTWMRAALAVAVVLAACGLLVEGSRGDVAGGDGCGVGSATSPFLGRFLS